MRITFLLTQDLSSPSGLGRYFPWAKELTRLGYDVRIIALHPDFERLSARHTVMDGVAVDYVGQMHVKKSGSTKTYFSLFQLLWVVFIGTLKLTVAVLAGPTDLIIIGKPHPMNSIAGLVAKFLRPHTHTILDVDDYEAGSNRFQSKWQKRLLAWFEDAMPRYVSMVTCNTHFNMSRLEKLGITAKKMVYLPNGIDADRFKSPDTGALAQLRKSLGLEYHQVIAYIGSMSLTNHAVDLLLRAFVAVRSRLPNARLLLVGGGEDLEKLQKLSNDLGIDDAVIFTGRVDPSQISLYYALSDLSVDPVHDDDAARGRCPLKMFETWACGVPFITGDVGDRKGLIGDSSAGLIVLPGDVANLVNAIIRILEFPETSEMMRRQGFLAVIEFQWTKITIHFKKEMISILFKRDSN
ncbi:MAG: glycosyltransferase family 4 protein [Chloroflexi bacterium]|nr:glycosyltransferase family 4 protein [Chloroflexota bacterium]